ncbi:MAG: hypothetical protein QM728_07630 [Gordonia sp. (in: high G+C Gram-positive bacteria)]|uniref:hypothetical protein n=1 Tax=Gordonia sp. (in: high G+C Gram-positive bacteria) TaxID=84139 RepID=UPI0039E58F9F
MTYYGGGTPGPEGHGRHRNPYTGSEDPQTTAYGPSTQAYSAGQQYPGAQEDYGYGYEEPDVEPEPEGKPPRHPAILASLVGVTVFLATSLIAITLWALNDSKSKREQNYAEGPSTTTVTVTESVTETTTTTVRPSRTRPSTAYESEDPDDPDTDSVESATTGWYAQYGSFTSLESAKALAQEVNASVYRGEEFGQPGQYIVAQREYSKSGAREACDMSEKACVVKEVE